MKRALIFIAALLASHQEPQLRSIKAPRVAKAAWSDLLACTSSLGVEVEPGGDLRDVKWFTAKLEHTRRGALLGYWAPPDSIVIDERLIGEQSVVEHELLHQLLRGPPAPFESHPFVPFAAPCRLMPYQTSVIDTTDGSLTFPDGLRIFPRVGPGNDIPTSAPPARVDTRNRDALPR